METHRLSLAGVSVAIGMPLYGDIPRQTAMALALTANECGKRGIDLDIIMVRSVLPWSRDDVADTFLKNKEQKLFWIDSDMVWTPEDFLRLLALSTVRDVVGAAYPAKVEGPTTFYAAYDGGIHSGEYGLLKVNGLGLGFTIVDRSVMEKLAGTKPLLQDTLQKKQVRSIFRFGEIDGHRQGEDMAFFADLRALGYDVWMDPSIELGHVGHKQWRGRIADAFTATDTEYVKGPNNRSAA